jgi:hypothetical protein
MAATHHHAAGMSAAGGGLLVRLPSSAVCMRMCDNSAVLDACTASRSQLSGLRAASTTPLRCCTCHDRLAVTPLPLLLLMVESSSQQPSRVPSHAATHRRAAPSTLMFTPAAVLCSYRPQNCAAPAALTPATCPRQQRRLARAHCSTAALRQRPLAPTASLLARTAHCMASLSATCGAHTHAQRAHAHVHDLAPREAAAAAFAPRGRHETDQFAEACAGDFLSMSSCRSAAVTSLNWPAFAPCHAASSRAGQARHQVSRVPPSPSWRASAQGGARSHAHTRVMPSITRCSSPSAASSTGGRGLAACGVQRGQAGRRHSLQCDHRQHLHCE